MSDTLLTRATAAPEKPFPLQEVIDCLIAELTTAARSEAEMEGVALPAEPAALRTMKIRLDSLVVVEITCGLESILGFGPKNIVRTGGYDSIGEALDHMVPRIEASWRKKHSGGF